jgi:hypothetical protein
MKRFSDFIKEEIDLRGNSGVPRDFMRNSEEEAERNLGIRPDDESQMREVWPDFQRLMGQSMQMMMQGPDGRPLGRPQMQERVEALQNLAKDLIMDEYGDILEASSKPVELDIKLVMMGQVNQNVPDLRDVPSTPERNPREDETHESEDEEDQDSECADGSCSNDDDDNDETTEDDQPTGSVLNAAMKKKILNMLTQGEGKATKDIIKASPIVEDGLQRIFGNNGERILRIWSEMSDIADKMDWIIPIQDKARMMSGNSGGMAGATDVTWESLNNSTFSIQLLKENQDYRKITIKAVGVDFPMLIHEAVKGIYLLIQSAAIKKDKEFAKKVKAATSSFLDEAQDFRYGVTAQAMFNDFINACKDSQKYRQMRTRVFRLLANDKERLTARANAEQNEELKDLLKKEAKLALTDEKFLEVFNSLLSVFDKVNEGGQQQITVFGFNRGGGRIAFVINQERFNQSVAKTVIEGLIKHIVDTEEAYEQAIKEWELEQKLGPATNYDEPDTEDDEDPLGLGLTKQEEPVDDGVYSDEDLSKMRKRDIQELMDAALDAGDYDEVRRLSGFLKEGAEIYLRELERINESQHTRRQK